MFLSGSQGRVKYSKSKDGLPIVVKTANYVDFSLELEQAALLFIEKDNLLSRFFPRCFGFKWITRDRIRCQALMMEKIAGEPFTDFILRKIKTEEGVDIVENLTLMTLCIMEMLRLKCGIVHNDLHSSNVLITRTSKDFFEFNFPSTTFSFKTYGFCPVIIDFGNAFVPDEKMMSPTINSSIGYFTGDQDCLADCRILLNDVCDLMRRKWVSDFTKRTKKLFAPLFLTRRGWFQDETFSDIADVIINELTETIDNEGLEKSAFDMDYDDIDDTVGLFISQVCPSFEDVDFNREEICQEFINLISSLMAFEPFSRANVETQQKMIKDALANKSGKSREASIHFDSSCCKMLKKFVSSISFLVNEILIINSCHRDKLYSELKVKNTIDVLFEFAKFKNLNQRGPNSRAYHYDKFEPIEE